MKSDWKVQMTDEHWAAVLCNFIVCIYTK